MVMAQLRGKVSENNWLGREDMLTGMVLGVLKNLDDSLACRILNAAMPLAGTTVATRLSMRPPLTWQFWPSWKECEPDVVIEGERNVLVIEVKLYSDFGKGEIEERQLAREWRDGSRYADRRGKHFSLLALTNHGSLPRGTLRNQLAGSDFDATMVFWLSWFEVGRAIRRASDKEIGKWRHDLLEVLTRMGLAPFDGFKEAVVELGDAVRADLPWLSSPFLPYEAPEPAGFAGFLDAWSAPGNVFAAAWEPEWSRPIPRAGFSRLLVDLANLNVEEGFPWRLKS